MPRLQRGLTKIQRRHPLQHQLDLVDLFHSRCPSTQPNTMTAARRSQRKNRSSRTLVLMATMRSSANDSQDQTISPAHLRQEHSTSASDRPRFSRIHGVPTGAPQLLRNLSLVLSHYGADDKEKGRPFTPGPAVGRRAGLRYRPQHPPAAQASGHRPSGQYIANLDRKWTAT